MKRRQYMTSQLRSCLNHTSILTRRDTPARESRTRAGIIRAALAIVVLGLPCAMAQAQVYTTLNDPSAFNRTYAYGIDGSNIVGFYTDNFGNNHGFLYNGSTYTTLNDPSATNGTFAL